MFELYLKKLILEKPVGEFVNYLAQATPGMSGADIANVCNEAALHAARSPRKRQIEPSHPAFLEQACELA